MPVCHDLNELSEARAEYAVCAVMLLNAIVTPVMMRSLELGVVAAAHTWACSAHTAQVSRSGVGLLPRRVDNGQEPPPFMLKMKAQALAQDADVRAVDQQRRQQRDRRLLLGHKRQQLQQVRCPPQEAVENRRTLVGPYRGEPATAVHMAYRVAGS